MRINRTLDFRDEEAAQGGSSGRPHAGRGDEQVLPSFGIWRARDRQRDRLQVWRGYSVGPDSDTLIDPQKTTSLGRPVGPDSSTKTWEGDQWKIGGGATWGWYSYDPQLNLMYYGSGNPS
jgi:hypothetical protein